MSGKKTNPRRIPVSMEDVNRARTEGQTEGAKFMAATIIMALTDVHDVPDEFLKSTWEKAQKLVREQSEGRLTYQDILRTLREEKGFQFNFD